MTQPIPLVSVIIPNYNYARTLGLCIRAVREQTYSPIEIIVADDCSTDDSVRIAKSLGATVVSTAGTSGPSVARNTGAAHARGDILFFIDSDVAIEPDSVAAAVRMLRADPKIGAICGVYHPDPLLRDSLVKEYRALQLHHWWFKHEGRMHGLLHTALFGIRAEVFREVGPFNPRYLFAQSADYGARLNERYEVVATTAIQGRHDHDPTLRTMLRKVFHRARERALYWDRAGVPGGSHSRALASGLILAAVLALPLPLLTGAAGAVVSPLLAAVAVALDGRTYRHLLTERGLPRGVYFVFLHFVVNVTVAIASATGVAQGLLSPRRSPADSPQPT